METATIQNETETAITTDALMCGRDYSGVEHADAVLVKEKFDFMIAAPSITDRAAFVKHTVAVMVADVKVAKQSMGIAMEFLTVDTKEDAAEIADEIATAARKKGIAKNGNLEQTLNTLKNAIGTPVAPGIRRAVFAGSLTSLDHARAVSRLLTNPRDYNGTKIVPATDPRVTADKIVSLCALAKIAADKSNTPFVKAISGEIAGRTPLGIVFADTPLAPTETFAAYEEGIANAKKAADALKQAAGSQTTPHADADKNPAGNSAPTTSAPTPNTPPAPTTTPPVTTTTHTAPAPKDKSTVAKELIAAWGVKPTTHMVDAFARIMVAASGMDKTDDVVFVLNSAAENAEDAAKMIAAR